MIVEKSSSKNCGERTNRNVEFKSDETFSQRTSGVDPTNIEMPFVMDLNFLSKSCAYVEIT